MMLVTVTRSPPSWAAMLPQTFSAATTFGRPPVAALPDRAQLATGMTSTHIATATVYLAAEDIQSLLRGCRVRRGLPQTIMGVVPIVKPEPTGLRSCERDPSDQRPERGLTGPRRCVASTGGSRPVA